MSGLIVFPQRCGDCVEISSYFLLPVNYVMHEYLFIASTKDAGLLIPLCVCACSSNNIA